jgi:putative membrane protein insertion efficiency factor
VARKYGNGEEAQGSAQGNLVGFPADPQAARQRPATTIAPLAAAISFSVMNLSRLVSCARQMPRLAGRALVQAYRLAIAPVIGMNCRHLPSCSAYADEALQRFGLWAGGWMTLARVLRCHPWGTHGLDFVPDALPEGARWYLPWRYGRWRGTNERK